MWNSAHSGTMLILLSLTGCGPVVDPLCEDCDPLRLTLATTDSGELAPHTSGAPFPWSWGFQGGTMITPSFALDPTQVGAGDRVTLTLRHQPDPEHPDAFGQVADFPALVTSENVWRTGGGALVIGPVLDQIGWTELDGVRLRLTAELRAEDGRTGSMTETLELAASMPDDPACASFALTNTGCTYRVFPGEATVTAIVDPAAGEHACADGRRVELSFAVQDRVLAEMCLASVGGVLPEDPQRLTIGAGASPPASCVDAAGITVGTTLPARYMRIVRGGCSPETFVVDVDLSACVCE